MAKLDTQAKHAAIVETRLAANQNLALSQSLSDPEAEILLLIAAGRPNTEIAVAVGADQAAVKEHIKSILRKAIASGSVSSRPTTIDLRPSELACEMVSPFTA
jgi:DNA-binding CsgD family transcriptional regulator